jgi:DNA gyrase/topoisomerase IV subunit B
MFPEQLWETTMNPDTRTLIRVQVEDEVRSSKRVTTLMGAKILWSSCIPNSTCFSIHSRLGCTLSPINVVTRYPDTRTLIRVQVEDEVRSSKRVTTLMGDKVQPRREWSSSFPIIVQGSFHPNLCNVVT